jgi:hypothetical protein
MHSPDQLLRDAIGGTRLLGGLFVLLGFLPLLALYGMTHDWRMQVLTIIDTVMLVGPGVWYLISIRFIRALQPWAIRVSLRVAVAQMVIVFIGLIIGLSGQPLIFRIPVILAIFFTPALAAQIYNLVRAGRAISLISNATHGFEPLRVLKVEKTTEELNNFGEGSSSH